MCQSNTTYFWIRVFDYVYKRDSNYESQDYGPENYGKGVLLDEFYLKDILDKEAAKKFVKDKYCGNTAQNITFAKPRKRDGIYALVMESNKYFYDRFYKTIDTFCFWHNCHKPIKGKAVFFPKMYIGDNNSSNDERNLFEDSVYFCSYECKSHAAYALSPASEGEFQSKETGDNGNIYGYIYLIYDRAEDTYYIGQTRYLPFFRWQEHIKSKTKGDIKDLTFSVLTEVIRNQEQTDFENQEYLTNIEAWWISKYQEDGFQVKNISKPRLTIDYLKRDFNEMISRNKQLYLIT